MNIRDELRLCADEMSRCIEQFKADATDPHGMWRISDPYKAKTTSGLPVLAELVAAQGQVLAALIQLGEEEQ